MDGDGLPDSAPRDSSQAGTRETQVAGVVTRVILIGLERLDVDIEAVCAPFRQDPTTLMEPTAQVPRGVAWGLLARAAHLSGDPSIGLRLAQTVPAVAAGGILAELAITARTTGDALDRFARFHKVLFSGLDVSVHVNDEASVDLFPTETDEARLRPAMEFLMGVLWRVLKESARQPIVATRVVFRHSPPAVAEPYETFFGCPVHFGGARYSLTLPSAHLAHEVVGADPLVASKLEEFAERELRKQSPEFPASVAENIRDALERGEHADCMLIAIAKHVGVSERTLQRKLRDDGLSFRGLVDEVRRKLALGLLASPELTISEVAAAAGFDEPTSLTRAVHRWTGQSPSEYRDRYLTHGP